MQSHDKKIYQALRFRPPLQISPSRLAPHGLGVRRLPTSNFALAK